MRRLISVSVVLASACTGRAPIPPIEVQDAWARPADSTATTAAYFVIVNHETTQVTLSAESSPIAESVALHETQQMSGMVHMTPLDAPQAIAPGDSLILKEGSKHLMVSGLKRKLVAGDSLPLLLTFSDGRVVHAAAVVRAP
jgi:copper(I)-binding protein